MNMFGLHIGWVTYLAISGFTFGGYYTVVFPTIKPKEQSGYIIASACAGLAWPFMLPCLLAVVIFDSLRRK